MKFCCLLLCFQFCRFAFVYQGHLLKSPKCVKHPSIYERFLLFIRELSQLHLYWLSVRFHKKELKNFYQYYWHWIIHLSMFMQTMHDLSAATSIVTIGVLRTYSEQKSLSPILRVRPFPELAVSTDSLHLITNNAFRFHSRRDEHSN